MIKWLAGLTGLSPLILNLGLYGILAFSALWLYRQWSNHVKDDAAREQMVDDYKKSAEKLTDLVKRDTDEINALKDALSSAWAENRKMNASLRQMSDTLYKDLPKTIGAIQAGGEVRERAVNDIPGDELDDAIRLQLQRLAAAAQTGGTTDH